MVEAKLQLVSNASAGAKQDAISNILEGMSVPDMIKLINLVVSE